VVVVATTRLLFISAPPPRVRVRLSFSFFFASLSVFPSLHRVDDEEEDAGGLSFLLVIVAFSFLVSFCVVVA
jgi:hypothetical protein